MALKFRRIKTGTGETRYMAETAKFRYYTYRAFRGYWTVEVWSLRTVGTVDPLTIADRQIDTRVGISYADAKSEASKYEEQHGE